MLFVYLYHDTFIDGKCEENKSNFRYLQYHEMNIQISNAHLNAMNAVLFSTRAMGISALRQDQTMTRATLLSLVFLAHFQYSTGIERSIFTNTFEENYIILYTFCQHL